MLSQHTGLWLQLDPLPTPTPEIALQVSPMGMLMSCTTTPINVSSAAVAGSFAVDVLWQHAGAPVLHWSAWTAVAAARRAVVKMVSLENMVIWVGVRAGRVRWEAM